MSFKTIISTAIPSLLLLSLAPAYAAQCSAQSGAQVVPLLELYTSEGCSSCPPADKWLSTLSKDASKVVPLAFHVDYWDYIGWKDRFAKAQYTNRQHQTAAFNHASFAYTPQVVVNGKDFKGWQFGRLNLKQAPLAPVDVSLEAVTDKAGDITLKSTANGKDSKNSHVYIALYENNLVSQVNAGENNGRELKHDYVVRELLGAYSMDSQNQFSKSFNLNPEWKSKKDAGAVIFVQDSKSGEILQSLQLAFCH
jgi:hypothetical protein